MALAELPAIWQRYADGELSFDQTFELAKFATADTDEQWAQDGPGYSAARLQRLAAQHHNDTETESDEGDDDDSEDEPPAQKPNSLRFEHHPDGQSGRLIADLDTATLAMIEAAIKRQAERYGPDPDTGTWAPLDQRHADALYDLVTAANPSAWADRATMVVHVPWDTLAALDNRPGIVDLPFAATISADLARHLAHTARLEVSLDNKWGNPIGIGRTSRNWPAHTYRRIHARDGGTCRWPGCNNQIGLEIHHEPPWPEGPTDTHHGFLLCKRHHRFRTAKEVTITGNPEADLHFYRPDGTEIGATRPPLHPDIRNRFRPDAA